LLTGDVDIEPIIEKSGIIRYCSFNILKYARIKSLFD
jgi:hypothetical protein